jgi:hypothetical protein
VAHDFNIKIEVGGCCQSAPDGLSDPVDLVTKRSAAQMGE